MTTQRAPGTEPQETSSTTRADGVFKSEIREGMRVDWNVPFCMSDGVIIRANIFRPLDQTRKVGTIASTGVYSKDLAIQDGYPGVWSSLTSAYPEVAAGSTNVHQNWEVVDPEKWVPKGFAVVRIDSRGAGTSDGYLDPCAPREIQDFADIIGRIAEQPWSNGNVGSTGISYFAITSWRVACLAPPALKAIAVWEGANDYYRESCYHGGILSDLRSLWYPGQVIRIQRGKKSFVSRATGLSVTGDEYSEEQLRTNRIPLCEEVVRHKLDTSFYRDRSSEIENIRCAVLSCANWGGQGLHLRGNIEGYLRARNADRYLEVHGLEHWTLFATHYGESMLQRYFGYYLNGEDTGWTGQPRVQLNIRHPGDRFDLRAEKEWPLARTQWTKLYLQPESLSLGDAAPSKASSLTYDPLTSTGLKFSTGPLPAPLEITGPLAAKLFVSSATSDADIFAVVRVFDPDGKEVLFRGTADPHTPVAQGWLRASQRKLDPEKTLPYRPYHSHQEMEILKPGQIVELDVEIWPTCIVIPEGHRIVLNIRGKDFDYTEDTAGEGQSYEGTVLTGMRGCGPFTHTNPQDRPPGIFGGKVSLHFGAGREPYLLLPVIPGI